jgi:hypothetical protein
MPAVAAKTSSRQDIDQDIDASYVPGETRPQQQ